MGSPVDLLAAGTATVVTRTARLARELARRVAAEHARAGRRVAPTPSVYPLDPWLEKLWEAAHPDRVLLAPAAERVLWERIIDDDARANADAVPADLLDRTNLARLAAEAWQRIHEHGEPPAHEWDATTETAAFDRWRRAFAEQLDARGWRTRPELAAEAARAIAGGRCEPPVRTIFVGFDRGWPALAVLTEALRAAGAEVDADFERAETEAIAVPRVRRHTTALEEVEAVSREIRAALENEPDRRIGVVVAQLSDYRAMFERVLAEELHPRSALLDELDSPRRFDLAGAPTLADYPIVAHAFDLLTLRRARNEFTLISRLLLSPYPREAPADATDAAGANDAAAAAGLGEVGDTDDVSDAADLGDVGDAPDATDAQGGQAGVGDCGDAELEARACAELALRDDGDARINIVGLARALRRNGARRSGRRIDRLIELLEEDDAASPRVWAKRFAARLRAMGWPGADLGEDERIAYARWRDALGELAALVSVEPSMTRGHALARLRRLAADTLVQAPSAGLRVQVMGPLDAAGLSFDRLYLVGFHARAFPEPVAPHPLLPVRWQVDSAQPRASAADELRFTRRVWQRLLACAPDVRASFALQGEGDERCQPSSFLMADDAADDAEPVVREPWYRERAGAPADHLVERAAALAPAALAMHGGTSLIKDQSECPFRALAARRLAVNALEAPREGPQADRLGSLVHDALAAAWRELVDSSALRALADDKIERLTAAVAERLVADDVYKVDPDLRAAAARWLAELTGAWLRYERDGREGDWKVLACEAETALELGSGLCLAGLRIDRVDELSDGRLLIIDYKTSTKAKGSGEWAGERPREPQLPIYALAIAAGGATTEETDATPAIAAGREVGAVAFANLVARDDLSLRGPPDFVIASGARPRADKDWLGWEAEVARWRDCIERLGWEYVEGRAAVDPLKEACTYCHREPLCRKFEVEGCLDEDDAAADGGAEGGS